MYLLKVGGDEVFLLVNKNWDIDDGEWRSGIVDS
jgi:hypothetical protein